ncbi:hypothetical protein HN512_05075 [Candidatus Peregrinibacteria bacterium]|jgi:cytochrome bd-type quinol oxidase subunit 2|nr:hypothetical protein [Candidatus Peregrinibacteria bacterium]MBT3599179.1 hypothetical protein [Candidatus Peregrinibacteria bacterium]MBT4366894.1 hypothetical protein [Candidatus Peregrinibacteria bacterium]MBT4585915.1 hypothetical protein [Candidatus Peregrinibacteria bacterium]MBT6730686.1 hypothetical protein [Candidatus Peregrinibacteria bacterium]
MQLLTYIFWPRPNQVGYDNPKIIAILAICISFIVASFIIKKWRKGLHNTQTKKLSKSWSTALIWFGAIGLVLVISRVEDISYVSMRFLWVLWLLILALYVLLQIKLFKAKHYEVLPSERVEDPRRKYLPKKK